MIPIVSASDGVQEVLLVRPIGHRAGRVLDGDVEAVQIAES
jgi:hypothetical protein